MNILFRMVGGLMGAAFLLGCMMKLYVLLLVQTETADPSPWLWGQIGVQGLLGVVFLAYAFRGRKGGVVKLPSVYGYDQPIPPTRSQPYV